MNNDHLIVIFDQSGSMASPFGMTSRPIAGTSSGKFSPRNVKIKAAQDELILHLKGTPLQKVTIIPFSDRVGNIIQGYLPHDLAKLTREIKRLEPLDSTNLADAYEMAVNIGKGEPHESTVQYVIVTDGLSDTIHKDVSIFQSKPKRQIAFGILIDPTIEGQNHLENIVDRYIPVFGQSGLKDSFEETTSNYQYLQTIKNKANLIIREEEETLVSFNRMSSQLSESKKDNDLVYHFEEVKEVYKQSVNSIKNILQQDLHFEQLEQGVDDLTEKIKTAKKHLTNIFDYKSEQYFHWSISCPKKFSKGTTSKILINIYPPRLSDDVIKELKEDLGKLFDDRIEEKERRISLILNKSVYIHVKGPDIIDEVEKILIKDKNNAVSFIAKPNDNCKTKENSIKASIRSLKGDVIYSKIFEVYVTDYVFDHISRPTLANTVSILTALGGISMFILTFLEKLNEVAGITSGSIFLLLVPAIQIYIRGIFSRTSRVIEM